ncbi:MAG: ABC transporter ATP-binding protein [Thermoleophilia bacterium]
MSSDAPQGLGASIRALLPHARPVRSALMLGVALAVIEVAIGLALPWPLQWVVDHVLQPSDRGEAVPDNADVLLLGVAGAYLVLVSLAALADYWSTRLLSAAGLQLGNGLRRRVFTHLQRLSLGYHNQQRVGDLSTRVTSDVDRSQDMLIQILAALLPNALLLVGMMTVMFIVDAWFTLIALSATPLLVFATYRATHRLKEATRSARRAEGLVAAAATENLGAIPLVQAFTLEDTQGASFATLTGSSLRANLQAARLQALFSPIVDISAAFSVALVLWLGATRVLDGDMTLGVLLVFMSYLASLYKPIKQLAKLSTALAKGAAATERVFTLLATEPHIKNRPTARRAPMFRGEIDLQDVAFSHGREEVLRGVTLHVAAGERVALVGRTGAGKTTLASLVPRLIDPNRGRVRIDGHDIRDLTIDSVRDQIAMVLQDTVLLRGSLRDNIAWGRPGAHERDIRRAARLALVDEFASRLPDGFDTVIGERGANLSGGQRQRVAIARAILRDAPIMILDEPTSALDPRSEELLVEALAGLPGDRTMLVIAHRLSTVRDADRVVVLDDGLIAEQGPHEVLMQQDGLYRRMAETSLTPMGVS